MSTERSILWWPGFDASRRRMKDVMVGKIKVRRWRALEVGEEDPAPPQVFKRVSPLPPPADF